MKRLAVDVLALVMVIATAGVRAGGPPRKGVRVRNAYFVDRGWTKVERPNTR